MSDKINIGIMGFGHIGRYIYENTLNSNLFQVKVISDIGDINSLNYLLNNNLRNKKIGVSIEDESFVYNGEKTKFVNGISPGDVNWGDYDVDWVIDATGKFLDKLVLDKHIESGANRVILASLPNNELDNLIIPGLNELDINENDKIISAGSSTTNAFGLMLKALNEFSEIECCSLTTIHSYTSDQPLLDIANTDLKRSRSAAKNIIPNYNFSSRWIEKILPEFKNKIFSTALNVPVQFGSLLDMTTVFKNDFENEEQVNFAIDKLALKFPSFKNCCHI
jgi:glyceraldehyde 3-phosphate dehydrogenase